MTRKAGTLVSYDTRSNFLPSAYLQEHVFLVRRATTFAVRRQRIPTTNTTTQGTFAVRRQAFQLATSSPPAGEETSALLFFSLNQRFRFAKNKERTPALLIWRRRPLATSLTSRPVRARRLSKENCSDSDRRIVNQPIRSSSR